MDRRDDAPGMLKCRVVDTAFTWGEDRPPRAPWHDTIIYELHVKGFTQLNPDIPPHLRGTYAGLATDPVIEHLKCLGITAVELMPVHAFVDERSLVEKKLKNYWGYNSIGFFAPDMRYAATGLVNEFKSMVKRLHSAGLEVILDVVYNHSAEGNHLGPTLSFRGIDNTSYYRLIPGEPRLYMDFTGCGNTLNMMHPRVLQLLMDSLRYWVVEMHVDGFRFDLAAALARELYEVNRLSAFFDVVHQDPVLSQVKLIAEPWDIGEGGYQVGNFPVLWTEWNGRYRDAVRSYWKGESGLIGDLAYRLTGSSDPAVLALRARQKRNFLATLLLSQGVPMLLAGDETGRTQRGNNNAYCQDNEISWSDWEHIRPEDEDLRRFVSYLIHLRRSHRVFSRPRFLRGEVLSEAGVKDITWVTPSGKEATAEDWRNPVALSLGYVLSGAAGEFFTPGGQRDIDESFLVMMNAYYDGIDFRFPVLAAPMSWEPLVDTSDPTGRVADAKLYAPGEIYRLQGHSFALFINRAPRPESPRRTALATGAVLLDGERDPSFVAARGDDHAPN